MQARTAALVNLREALAVADKEAGVQATGMVEKKLLGRKVTVEGGKMGTVCVCVRGGD
jgi:hypothetical protein